MPKELLLGVKVNKDETIEPMATVERILATLVSVVQEYRAKVMEHLGCAVRGPRDPDSDETAWELILLSFESG